MSGPEWGVKKQSTKKSEYKQIISKPIIWAADWELKLFIILAQGYHLQKDEYSPVYRFAEVIWGLKMSFLWVNHFAILCMHTVCFVANNPLRSRNSKKQANNCRSLLRLRFSPPLVLVGGIRFQCLIEKTTERFVRNWQRGIICCDWTHDITWSNTSISRSGSGVRH